MGGRLAGPGRNAPMRPGERSTGDGQTNTAMHATATSNKLHAINTPKAKTTTKRKIREQKHDNHETSSTHKIRPASLKSKKTTGNGKQHQQSTSVRAIRSRSRRTISLLLLLCSMSSISSSPPPALPPIGANNNRMDDDVATPGVKREAGSPVTAMRYAKKPRDNRLRECFIITPIEGGGESIICKHCPDYNKTLQKFNPTKARSHLTAHCPGVDDALRQLLLDTTQAAKKSQSQIEASEAAAITISTAIARSSAEKAASAKMRKLRGRNRSSPSYISVHTEDTTLDITAPIENDELLLRLSFPSDNLKLNFNAEKNIFGAALCIDGFMNLKSHATWTASMCSMTSEGTRAGPHCQWPLNPDASGKFEGGLTRVQKVEQILKALIMI